MAAEYVKRHGGSARRKNPRGKTKYYLTTRDTRYPQAHPLSAYTEKGARSQAKKKAKFIGCTDYTLHYRDPVTGAEGWVKNL